MKVIELTKGHVAIVDDKDFEELAQYRWSIHNHGYAVRNGPQIKGVRSPRVYMHRQILKPSEGMEVDHINGNKLDNRRCNLRQATHSQNGMNRTARRGTKLGLKGVYFHTQRNKYCAAIHIGGVKKSLGLFFTPEAAKAAYDKAAIELHGEFARLN